MVFESNILIITIFRKILILAKFFDSTHTFGICICCYNIIGLIIGREFLWICFWVDGKTNGGISRSISVKFNETSRINIINKYE
jgi:hypothetical protein